MVKESYDTILSISAGPRTVLYFRLPLLEVSTLTWSTQNKNEVEKKKKGLHFFCVYIYILPPFCLSLPLLQARSPQSKQAPLCFPHFPMKAAR